MQPSCRKCRPGCRTRIFPLFLLNFNQFIVVFLYNTALCQICWLIADVAGLAPKPLPSFVYAQGVRWQVPLDAVGCSMSKRVLSLPVCRMSLIWVIVVERRAVKKWGFFSAYKTSQKVPKTCSLRHRHLLMSTLWKRMGIGTSAADISATGASEHWSLDSTSRDENTFIKSL